jgi:hypothetical protein
LTDLKLDELRGSCDASVMRNGMASWVLLACAATVLWACGGEKDEDDAAPGCGTTAQPLMLSLGELKPAPGSSVPNTGIVHEFTVIGLRAVIQPDLRLMIAHTAGSPDPAQLMVSIDPSSPDVRYTFAPLRWTNAPAQVALEVAGLYQTQEGCTYAFPSPLFSYSVAAN